MPRFFVSPSQIVMRGDGTGSVTVTGDDAAHITKSLRMKPGDDAVVCDGACRDYFCRVSSVGESVVLDIISDGRCAAEPPYRADVYQALIKGDKFDTVIQKAVECGAARIIPFISSRCVVRLDKGDAAKKLSRWQRIAEEAAKQCGRGIIPTVEPLMSFEEAAAAAAENDLSLFCYENERERSLRGALTARESAKKVGTVAVMIGSEGGFSPDEAKAACAAGMTSISLGHRILRTETAAQFVLACLSYELEQNILPF